MDKLKIKKTQERAVIPTRSHATDAGLDLYVCSAQYITGTDKDGKEFANKHGVFIDTGIAVEIPSGYAGFVMPRSSMNKKGWSTPIGVIDSGYSGSIKIVLWSISLGANTIDVGDKVAQLVIMPIALPEVEVVEELSESERSDKGFGSTDEQTTGTE